VTPGGSGGTEPLIGIDDLRVNLGGTPVLRGVDASVERGRFVGLVGPNGAGKTTLLRAVAGVIDPESGHVSIDGDRINDLPSKAASRLVATVPQDPTVAFEFDVRTVVAMGRNPHRSRFGGWTDADASAVNDALDRTDTRQFADREVTTLSGGERQRVLLARALAQAAPVLLLDEPTGSLDIDHQVRTLELVRELVADGRTAIAAIHDLDLAARYCDELLLVSGGEVVATGPPAAVLTEPAIDEAFGARAVVSRHPVTGSASVTALPEGTQGEENGAGRVHVVGDDAAVRHLYALDAAGFEVSVGAANVGSTVCGTARSLGMDVVTVPPFAGVDREAAAAVARRVGAADCVVVGDVAVGTGNLPNLRAASGADSIVVVESRPFEERNHAGPAAAEVYRRIRERATVVTDGDVVRAVAAAVDRNTTARSPAAAAAAENRAGSGGDP
jgi:iron complex transport system ATP-binding protein